jgi:hypothetical protein
LIDEVYAVTSAGVETTLEFLSVLERVNETIGNDRQYDDNDERSDISNRLASRFLVSFIRRWHGGAQD